MASQPTVSPNQIKRAREVLQSLPQRDNRLTRSEAAALLEVHFRRAFRKGYTPAELSRELQKEKIFIPAYLIDQFYGNTLQPEPASTVEPEQRKGHGKKTVSSRVKSDRAETGEEPC